MKKNTETYLASHTGLAIIKKVFTGAVLTIAIVMTTISHSTAQTIYTYAGINSNGYSGDGGAATSAEISAPGGVAVDGSGNVYIADRGNHVIRKVDASGNISTIAGNGTAGYAGDGGQATAAKLNSPIDVTVDGSGNIYIADAYNYCIRKVNNLGVISTIAGTGTSGWSGSGGAATASMLGFPWGVAVDGSGNVLIADANNYRVLKVNAGSGVLSVVTGDGTNNFSGDGGAASAAQVSALKGVEVDGSGNIYIADDGNNRLRMIDVSSGNISTIAGDGTHSYSGDGGPATAAEIAGITFIAADGSGNIYFTERDNSVLRFVDMSSGDISTIAGIAGSPGYSGDGNRAEWAELNFPHGIDIDGSGDLFIGDATNYVIREIKPIAAPLYCRALPTIHCLPTDT